MTSRYAESGLRGAVTRERAADDDERVPEVPAPVLPDVRAADITQAQAQALPGGARWEQEQDAPVNGAAVRFSHLLPRAYYCTLCWRLRRAVSSFHDPQVLQVPAAALPEEGAGGDEQVHAARMMAMPDGRAVCDSQYEKVISLVVGCIF